MENKGGLLKIPAIHGFLTNVSLWHVFDDVIVNYGLPKERRKELVQLTAAVVKNEMKIEQMPTLIAQAFGVDEETAKKIAADLAGFRLLPLANFIPGVEEAIKGWGGDVSKYPKDRIAKPEHEPDAVATGLLEKHGASLPPVLQQRFVFLTQQYIKGEKDGDWLKAFLTRGTNIGGLELSEESANGIIEALDREIKALPVPTKEIVKEEVKAEMKEVSKSKPSVTEPFMDSDRPLTKEEIEKAYAHLEALATTNRPVKNLRALPKKQVKEVAEALTIEEVKRMEAELEAKNPIKTMIETAKKMPQPAKEELISKEEASDVKAVGARKTIDLSVHKYDMDGLYALFDKRRVPRATTEQFAGIFVRGIRTDKQAELLLLERFGFTAEEVDEALKLLHNMKDREAGQAVAEVREEADGADLAKKEQEILSLRHAEITKKMSSEEEVVTETGARVSASRSKEEELALQEAKLDVAKIKEAMQASRPEPVAPRLSSESLPPVDGRGRLTDVKYVPKLLSAVDELKTMGVEEFRRLSSRPDEARKKLEDKVLALRENSEEERIAGVQAFRKSPLFTLYRTMLEEALASGTAIAEISAKRRNAGLESLTPGEVKAIILANQHMVY